MRPRSASATAVAVAGLLLATAVLAVGATISNRDVDGEVLQNEKIRHVRIDGSEIGHASIGHAGTMDSHIHRAHLFRASVTDSYLEHLSVRWASVTDSRVAHATLRDVTLQDATLCMAAVKHGDETAFQTADCRLVSTQDSSVDVHARLFTDAPETAAPGDEYDLDVWVAESGTLTVRNDPAGLTAIGFDPTAADASVMRLQTWVNGEMLCEFQLGESCDLAGNDRFTLRVKVAEEGIVDGSTIGLVLDVNGHGLRPAITTLDVVATALAFAPLEGQAFAPFLADNVARLVISVATDEHGNVDRDLDIAYEVDVLGVDSGHDEGAGPKIGEPIQNHSSLHGDAELFSENPFGYSKEVSEAAHHPATLESILRDTVGLDGITYGAANFYATHLVAQSPYYTKVTLHAWTTNANGDRLEAAPIEIELARLPEDERPVDHPFGPLGDKVFPGEGMLRVEFVDSNGNAVDRKAGWTLVIEETPESHRTKMRIVYEADGGSVDKQPLASSEPVGLPFGDFVPHEYKVCLHHDGMESCANDGALVRIDAGETTTVQIVVG